MKICIAGKNRIAIEATQRLLETEPGHEVIGCKNATDDEVDGWQPSFGLFCKRQGVPLVALEDLRDVRDLLLISLEYDKIIRVDTFQSRQLYNIHFSKLPAYKGMYTSVMPLLFGERQAGVTLHRIDRGIDTGEIVDQMVFPLSIDVTARELYDLYLENGSKLFARNIASLISGEVASKRQDVVGSSYFSKAALDFSNITINLKKTAYEIHNQIRAFCFREYQLPRVLDTLIYRSEMLSSPSTGKACSVVFKDDFVIVLNAIDYQIKLFVDKIDSLVRASEQGDIALYRVLKDREYPTDVRTKRGWNALIIACYHNQAAFVEMLLAEGADVNSSNYNGTTALMYAMTAASKDGKMDGLVEIAKNGPDWERRDNKGKTVFDYAAETGNSEVLRFIEKARF